MFIYIARNKTLYMHDKINLELRATSQVSLHLNLHFMIPLRMKNPENYTFISVILLCSLDLHFRFTF